MISYAERRRRAYALGARIRNEGVARRHLVAVFEDAESRLLLVYNRQRLPPKRSAALGFLSLADLPSLELETYRRPFLAFPAIEVLKPELAEHGPFFYSLAKAVYSDSLAPPEVAATRQGFADWLARARNGGELRHTKLVRQELEDHVRRLLLTNLLSSLESVEGLLAVIPGADLEDCDLDATLVYRADSSPPEGSFEVVELPGIDDLSQLEVPEGVAPYLASPLAALWPGLPRFQSIRRLLVEAGGHHWEEWIDDAMRSREWIEQSGGERQRQTAQQWERLAVLPRTVADKLHSSRDESLGCKRVTFAEEAYFSTGFGSRARWAQRGPERLRHTVFKQLLQILAGLCEIDDPPRALFWQALLDWYSLAHIRARVRDDPDRGRQRVEQELIRIRGELERFRQQSPGPSLEKVRAESLGMIIDRILRLARRGFEPAQQQELAALLEQGKRRALVFWQPAPEQADEASLDFTLLGLARHLVLIGQIEAEIRHVEIMGGDAQTRSAELRRLARRIQEYPRFANRLDHEGPVFDYVCGEIGELARRRAARSAGRPVLKLTVHTSNVLFEEESIVTLELENEGTIPARLVVLQLQHTADFDLAGEGSVWYWEHLGPLRSIKLGIPLVALSSKSLELIFESTYYAGASGAEAESPDRNPEQLNERFVHQLVVLSSAGSDRPPAIRPDYPAGRHLERPEQFHGRRREINKILSHLASDSSHSFLIRSPRRTGKSSLAHMVHRALRERETRRYFELPESWDTTLDQRPSVFISAQATEGSERPQRELFRLLLQEVEGLEAFERGSLSSRYEALAALNPTVAFAETIDHAFEELPAGCRLVVLIDEFDALHAVGMAGFYAAFRSVVDKDQRIVWILISASGLMDTRSQYGSPIFNLFTPIDLQILSRESVHDLVCRPARDVEFLDEAIEEIYGQAGGNAYFTNVLCGAVMDQLYALSTSRVRRITVIEAARSLVGQREHDSFVWIWNDADDLARALLLILAAAKGPRTVEELLAVMVGQEVFSAAPPDEVSQCVEMLRLQGILRVEGGRWAFAVAMVKTWLQVGVLDEDSATWFTTWGRDT